MCAAHGVSLPGKESVDDVERRPIHSDVAQKPVEANVF
eukprot:COSAG03_NODE_2075_length_3155_cov_1.569372_5_plen_38_part_00